MAKKKDKSLMERAKDFMDDLQKKHNPTDPKVKKALEDAGLASLKRKQDKLAGISRRT